MHVGCTLYDVAHFDNNVNRIILPEQRARDAETHICILNTRTLCCTADINRFGFVTRRAYAHALACAWSVG